MGKAVVRSKASASSAPAKKPPEKRVSAQQMRVLGRASTQPFDLFESQSRVNPVTALTLSAVFCAISQMSRDLARVPLYVYKRRPDGRGADVVADHPLNQVLSVSPDGGYRTSFSVRQTMAAHCLGYGNAVAEIERSRDGKVVYGYHPIHPTAVEVVRYVEGGKPKLKYKLACGKELDARDVIHYYGMTYDGIWGVSPISAASTSLALGMSGDAYSLAFFANGSIPSGFIKHTGKYSPEVEKAFLKSWGDNHRGAEKAYRLAMLFNNAEFIPAQISPIDAQLLESRRYSVADVARIFQIPLTKLMEWSNSHFANYEESQLDYIANALTGWCDCIEQAYTLKLLTQEELAAGYYIEHDMRRLYRGNFEAMAKYNAAGIQNGWRTQNEVRDENGDAPLTGGDRLYIQKNMIPVDKVDEILLAEAKAGAVAPREGAKDGDQA